MFPAGLLRPGAAARALATTVPAAQRPAPRGQLAAAYSVVLRHKFCQPRSAKQGPLAASENFMSL